LIRRNKAAVAIIAIVAVALGTLGAAAALAYRQEQQRLTEERAHEQRLLAEKRQNALEKALMAAMNGDFVAAEKAIDQAELLGAAPGQARMLRGHVAFHGGDIETAISHLEQATKLLPEGQGGAVAARAMLARACMNSAAHLSRFVELSRELDHFPPRTAEDFLFKGLLETTIFPERGLQTLDEGIRRHDSVVARATRLEARANRALVTGEAGVAELAMEDARVALGMLPGNALVLARSVFAHLVLAGIYEAEGRAEESERVLAQAGPLVQQLEEFSATDFAAHACFEFFEYVGDEEAAYSMSGRGSQLRRAVMLYRRGEFVKALDAAVECSRHRVLGPTERIERAVILAELPDGPGRARSAFEELKDDGGWPLTPPMILLFLGKPEEARQAFLQVPKEELPPWDNDWHSNFLDYNRGRITADALLQDAGQDRPKLSDAHFVIGLWRLSEGDRASAREHFQKCVATRVFQCWHWPWVRAFLERMQRDPGWPPWIAPQ
jgi:tetratricopeptide (TPR) repeat protein